MSTDPSAYACDGPIVRRPARLLRVVVAALLLTACGSGADSSDSTSTRPRATPEPDETATPASRTTPVRVTLGDTVISGRLFDNATANDLVSQLPLTLAFRLNGVEKTAPL